MKRRVFALAAAAGLILGLQIPVLAVPAPVETAQFLDLDPDRSPDARPWYDYHSIRVCVEAGLMVGSEGYFHPARSITVAEVITLCARIHSRHSGTPIPAGETWYDGPTALLKGLAGPETQYPALTAEPTALATRADFASLLDLAWRDETAAVNRIEFIPDTSDPAVLRLYNAGVLTGTDQIGSFTGWRGLTRAEAAAMAARVVEPSLRKRISFTPVEVGPEPTPDLPPEVAPSEAPEAIPSDPPEEEHDHDSRSAALEQLAGYLSRRTGLTNSAERDGFCYEFGIAPHTPLLSLPYEGSLTACELLPFFAAITEVQLKGALENKGLTPKEFWDSSFRTAGMGDPLTAGDYLKTLLEDGICESLLILRGAKPSQEDLTALRGVMAKSDLYRELDPRALYEFAQASYPHMFQSP